MNRCSNGQLGATYIHSWSKQMVVEIPHSYGKGSLCEKKAVDIKRCYLFYRPPWSMVWEVSTSMLDAVTSQQALCTDISITWQLALFIWLHPLWTESNLCKHDQTGYTKSQGAILSSVVVCALVSRLTFVSSKLHLRAQVSIYSLLFFIQRFFNT